MSFALADLKKTVRKAREGYQVTPTRLEGRPAALRVEFVLRQLEDHLGRERRELDPAMLVDYLGDGRLGRGLLATLSQWYRVRPQTFAEVLENRRSGARTYHRLVEHGLLSPADLRARLFAAANSRGPGYLDPEEEFSFWQRQARSLGLQREDLSKLLYLDSPDEAILVRTAPRPLAVDVMAAYNARAHTTLLRSASEVLVRSAAPAASLQKAAELWASGPGVEWRLEKEGIRLLGRADALGCWTRHGRHVERAVLELVLAPEVAAREIEGQVQMAGKTCRFRWKSDILEMLQVGKGGRFRADALEQIDRLAADLRRQREGSGSRGCQVRRAAHVAAAAGGAFQPHLAVRNGDAAIYLRSVVDPGPRELAAIEPFQGKTPVALVDPGSRRLYFPGETPQHYGDGSLLNLLIQRLPTPNSRIEKQDELPAAA